MKTVEATQEPKTQELRDTSDQEDFVREFDIPESAWATAKPNYFYPMSQYSSVQINIHK